MPIYEYRCSACGQEHEALQKLSEAPLSVCPACGAPKLVKLVTAAGFQLKGSGWYVTDFRSSGNKPAAKASDGETNAAEGKSGTETAAKSETATKSETKTESAPSSTATASTGSGTASS